MRKLFAVLAVIVVAILVYDRVWEYRRETAAIEAARQKEIWEGLHRCEDALPIPDNTATPDQQAAWHQARKACQDFWIPQVAKK